MRRCLVALLFFMPLLAVASTNETQFEEKCTEEQATAVELCVNSVQKAARGVVNNLPATKRVCEMGHDCFEKIKCAASTHQRNTLVAGCDYDIFLTTVFRDCRDMIMTKSDCLSNYGNSRNHCEASRELLRCVLPLVKSECGSDTLGEIFRKKFALHNNLSFDCGL